MTIWCCVTPERRDKTKRIMYALSEGVPGGRVTYEPPPDDGEAFVVWGQIWLAERTIPKALREGRPFWQIDNGFFLPAKGAAFGYYRLSYRSLSPILLREVSEQRASIVKMKPWRTVGSHVLLAMPGDMYGKSLGLSMETWKRTVVERIRASTKRRIIVRSKTSSTPLSHHFSSCWAVVTHSSNAAVDAVVAGVPVFVEKTCPAAPVGRTDMAIEDPVTPDRNHWAASLACQQFTLAEMRSGVAWKWMEKIARQVDSDRSGPRVR